MKQFIDRQAALDDFLKRHVLGHWEEKLADLLTSSEQYMEDMTASLIKAVEAGCKQVRLLQDKQLKGEIRYIHFSLLRTRLREREACYRLDFYDEQWVLDEMECSVYWRAEPLFAPLFRQAEVWERELAGYARKVTLMDVERFLQIEAMPYHALAVEYLRASVPELIGLEDYVQMRKRPELGWLAGEYKDSCEIIWSPEGDKE